MCREELIVYSQLFNRGVSFTENEEEEDTCE